MRKRPRTEMVPAEHFGELLAGIDLRDHGGRLAAALRDATEGLKGNEGILLSLQIKGWRLADFTIEFLEK
jgi:hypothetical protein